MSRKPVGDRFSGAAVAFSPLGTAGGGSTANAAAALGMTGAVPSSARPRDSSQYLQQEREKGPQSAQATATSLDTQIREASG